MWLGHGGMRTQNSIPPILFDILLKTAMTKKEKAKAPISDEAANHAERKKWNELELFFRFSPIATNDQAYRFVFNICWECEQQNKVAVVFIGGIRKTNVICDGCRDFCSLTFWSQFCNFETGLISHFSVFTQSRYRTSLVWWCVWRTMASRKVAVVSRGLR